jgi:hypothetical protein
VLQFDAGNFFFAFENLLEDADEVDERDNEFSFRTFVVVEGFVRLGPDVFLDLLSLVEKLGGVLEFFVLQEALDKFFARVFSLLVGTGQGVRREKHLGLDVDKRRRHVNELRGHIYVELFELMKIVEVLRRDLGDLDIVNVHFLLFDEVEQEIERTLEDRNLDAIW